MMMLMCLFAMIVSESQSHNRPHKEMRRSMLVVFAIFLDRLPSQQQAATLREELLINLAMPSTDTVPKHSNTDPVALGV